MVEHGAADTAKRLFEALKASTSGHSEDVPFFSVENDPKPPFDTGPVTHMRQSGHAAARLKTVILDETRQRGRESFELRETCPRGTSR
jgi:hypothetical protein